MLDPAREVERVYGTCEKRLALPQIFAHLPSTKSATFPGSTGLLSSLGTSTSMRVVTCPGTEPEYSYSTKQGELSLQK